MFIPVVALTVGACGSSKNNGDDDDSAGSSGDSSGGTSASGGTSGSGGSTGGRGGTSSGGSGTGGSGGASGSGTGGRGGTSGGSGGSSGSAGSDTQEVCQSAADKLASCELLEGSVDCATAPSDPLSACVFACYGPASCEDIQATVCAATMASFADCLTACQDIEVMCDDGTSYPASWMCDGFADCPNAEDEADCGQTFDCGDGSTVPGSYVCDDFLDCNNGADEANCATLVCPEPPPPEQVATCDEAAAHLRDCNLLTAPQMTGCLDEVPQTACGLGCLANASCADLSDLFCNNGSPAALVDCATTCQMASTNFTCGSGERISGSWQCDEYDDCADGSDEAGCTFSCSSGGSVPYAYLCDGADDCAAGEDEIGCTAECGN